MSRIAKLIIVLAILLFGLAFHLKNNFPVELNYYVGTTPPLPLSVVVVIVLCLGAVLGVLASLPIIIKLKSQKLKLEKQIKNSEKEINNLRVMPVKD
jgi:lipopolysaccharide assembly protein A